MVSGKLRSIEALFLLKFFFYGRGVAQPGSAPEWGSGGRRFKSSRPDHKIKHLPFYR